MKVLFLDIDGVLNAHEFDESVMCGQIHKDKVELLNRVLLETDAKIVLSSAWRYLVHRGEMNLRGMEWLLRSHGVLADRLIGITRPDTMHNGEYNGVPGTWPVHNERGQQITDWLHTSIGMVGAKPALYAVVDDLDLGIIDAGHPLVLTDGTKGLHAEDCDRLIAILNGGAA